MRIGCTLDYFIPEGIPVLSPSPKDEPNGYQGRHQPQTQDSEPVFFHY